jgi:antirestriction protein ArdC
METQTKTQNDVYSIINSRIISALEAGVAVWQKPWSEAGLPQNLITRKPYTGINVLLLTSMGFSRNFFLTFKQLMALNSDTRIRKGEKSIPVIFWKRLIKQEADEQKTTYLLRYYSVFNVDQCIGIPEEKIPTINNNTEQNRMEKLEAIIDEMPKKPRIQHKENQAYYNPIDDFINMPKMNNFKNTDGYFSTLFHELIHSTGHSSRIGRKEVMESASFGSEPYSMEELVAEIGSCYLQSYSGIETKDFNNNVAYIQNWLNVLQNDKKFIIYASAKAQKAVDYILNRLGNKSEN